MARIDAKDGKFVVTFDYHPELVEAIKKVPGRRFQNVKDHRCWVVPASSVEELARLAKRYGFSGSEEARQLARETRAMVVSSSASESDLEVEGLGGTLRPFQKAGVEYALKARRCFIADEMGLGKTIEALATIQAAGAYPTLVVCPASLKLNWEREAKKWLPGKTVEIMAKEVPSADIVIINYDVLRKVKEALATHGFKAIVLDESHYVKNYRAQRSVAAKAIALQAPIRLALTGTPLLNRPQELISQLQILDRLGDMGGFWNFAKRYCEAYRSPFGWDMSGANHLGELNDRLRASCYIRRKKSEVLTELPDKVRSVVPVALTNKAEYDAAEADLKGFLKDFQQVTDEDIARKMRAKQLVKIEVTKQVAARGKMEAVKEWVASFLESGEKLVLFAHHQSVVKELAEAFEAPCITGETPIKHRQAIVDRFQDNPECRLVVCNIQAGGLGVTLTAASNVAFVELGWTPAVHDQAEDRCHRIGQKDSVNAWYFLAKGTVDDLIFDLIEKKREVVDGAVEGAKQAGIVNALALEILSEKRPERAQAALSPEEPSKRARSVKTGAAKPVKSTQTLPTPQDSLRKPGEVEKALLALYRRQTIDEQDSHHTTYQNARGFNAIDAAFGASLAERILKGQALTSNQGKAAERLLKKYRRQLKEEGIEL